MSFFIFEIIAKSDENGIIAKTNEMIFGPYEHRRMAQNMLNDIKKFGPMRDVFIVDDSETGDIFLSRALHLLHQSVKNGCGE